MLEEKGLCEAVEKVQKWLIKKIKGRHFFFRYNGTLKIVYYGNRNKALGLILSIMGNEQWFEYDFFK